MELRERIKDLIDESGRNQSEVAAAAGIESGLISRILSGKRGVRIEHLEKIGLVLGVPLSAFFQVPLQVPIIGEINYSAGPPNKGLPNTPEDFFQLFQDERLIEKCYALRVADRSMLPLFRPGTFLIAQRDNWETIQSNDLIVYRGEELLQVRQVFLTVYSIILKGVNPLVEEMDLPLPHLKMCDKIIQINPA